MHEWSIPDAQFAAILGCSEDEWAQVRLDAGASLSPTASDRLGRMLRVLDHARAVFDERRDTVDWLSTSNDALSGASPLSLMHTAAGARRVDAVLTRLEFGVYA